MIGNEYWEPDGAEKKAPLIIHGGVEKEQTREHAESFRSFRTRSDIRVCSNRIPAQSRRGIPEKRWDIYGNWPRGINRNVASCSENVWADLFQTGDE